jgi:hypothetical protein
VSLVMSPEGWNARLERVRESAKPIALAAVAAGALETLNRPRNPLSISRADSVAGG